MTPAHRGAQMGQRRSLWEATKHPVPAQKDCKPPALPGRSHLECAKPKAGGKKALRATRVTATETEDQLPSLLAGPHRGGGWEVGGCCTASPLGPPAQEELAPARSACTSLLGAWLAAAHIGFHGAHSCHAICSTAGSPGPCALSEWPRGLACARGGDAGTRPTALSTEELWGAGAADAEGGSEATQQEQATQGPLQGQGVRAGSGQQESSFRRPCLPEPGRSAPGPLDPTCSGIILRAPTPSIQGPTASTSRTCQQHFLIKCKSATALLKSKREKKSL